TVYKVHTGDRTEASPYVVQVRSEEPARTRRWIHFDRNTNYAQISQAGLDNSFNSVSEVSKHVQPEGRLAVHGAKATRCVTDIRSAGGANDTTPHRLKEALQRREMANRLDRPRTDCDVCPPFQDGLDKRGDAVGPILVIGVRVHNYIRPAFRCC